MNCSISLRKAPVLTASGAALCFSNAALAQTAAEQDDTSVQQTVIVTGTRGAPRTTFDFLWVRRWSYLYASP